MEAIWYGGKVEGLRVQGDYIGATAASNNAKTWMIISFVMSGFGLVMSVISLITDSI